MRRLLAFTLVLPLACNKPQQPQQGAASPSGGPIAVKVASPKMQTIKWSVEQPASVMSYEITPVAVRLSGYVASIAKDDTGAIMDIGSIVRPQQPLAKLEVPELAPRLAEKNAAVDQATAELNAAKEGLKVLDALVDEAKAKAKEAEAGVVRAQADVDRWTVQLTYEETLLSKGQIDQQSRDVTRKQLAAATAAHTESQARVVSAKAAVTEREAQRKRGDADVNAAAARVSLSQAQVKGVEEDLKYTEVKAPYAGIITSRAVHSGHYVQPGTVVFTVARIDRVRVGVDVPEIALEKARPGSQVVVRVPSLNNREYAATVTRTTGVVNPETRTLRAEIEIENKDGMLKPGAYAFVSIKAETAEAIMLPDACVLAADETQYVYLVEDGKAVKYRVRTGRSEAGQIQVIDRRRASATSGEAIPFTGSEKAVKGNLGALTDGAAVEVKE